MTGDQVSAATPAPPRTAPHYSENGCGNRVRTLVLPGIALLAALLAVLGTVLGDPDLLSLLVVTGLLGPIGWAAAGSKRGLGIRLDQDGLRIGGVRRAERRPASVQAPARTAPGENMVKAGRKSREVCSADWASVRRVVVLSEPEDVRRMSNRQPGKYELWAPWWANAGRASWAPGRYVDARAKGALVVEVERERVEYRPVDPPTASAALQAQTVYAHPTMVWAIPTKHPEKLHAALAEARPPLPLEDPAIPTE
jgi:hypothetical protein